MKEQKRPFCAKWHHILIFISLFMQDDGISRQRSFCLPAGGLTTFSSRSDVRSRKWREMELSPTYFLPAPFSAKPPPPERLSHLFVFFVVSFLWRSSEDKRKSPVIGYSQDKIFFKKWKKSILGGHQYRQWWCEIVASRISSIGSWRHVTCARSPTWLILFFLLDLYRLWLKSNNSKRTHPPPSKDFSGIFFLEAVNARRWDQ